MNLQHLYLHFEYSTKIYTKSLSSSVDWVGHEMWCPPRNKETMLCLYTLLMQQHCRIKE